MPPNRFSRHRFCTAAPDEEGRLFLDDRPVYGYRDLPDNRQHVVREGDTLWGLADLYFASMPRAAGFWWAIADFQPDPVHDPTIALTVGTTVVIPSLRTLQQEILNDARRRRTE
jgi:hypothetical protein